MSTLPTLCITGKLIWISRGFPKVDHSGIDARIVLEQNKFTKQKLPLTVFEPSALLPVYSLMPSCQLNYLSKC